MPEYMVVLRRDVSEEAVEYISALSEAQARDIAINLSWHSWERDMIDDPYIVSSFEEDSAEAKRFMGAD